MSCWMTPDGGRWFGPDDRGDFHPEGADTDMSDLSRAEIEESFGSLVPSAYPMSKDDTIKDLREQLAVLQRKFDRVTACR